MSKVNWIRSVSFKIIVLYIIFTRKMYVRWFDENYDG